MGFGVVNSFLVVFWRQELLFVKRGNNLHLLSFDKERKAELLFGMEIHEERAAVFVWVDGTPKTKLPGGQV